MATPPSSTEIWDFWADGDHSPGLNMAFDQALLDLAPDRRRPLLRCYGWDRPTISLGYSQAHEAARKPGFALIRRPTGGGIVLHDHDFTYTVVVPAGHWLCATARVDSYGWVNRAVADALGRVAIAADLTEQTIAEGVDRRRMVCFSHPTRYDIMADNRKVAGSAQRRTSSGILHQGSIHFGGPAPVPRDALQRAMLDGFRHCLVHRFVPFAPDDAVMAAATELFDRHYGTEAWNNRR